MKKLLLALFVSLVSLVIASTLVAAGTQEPPIVAYPVAGTPHHVAAESSGSVWYTVPDEDLIGHLTVTSTIDYAVMTYTTTLTEPHDIVYAAGRVWFSSLGSNAIGSLDPADGTIDAYPIPTAASRPVALDVLPGTPLRVWFAQEATGALGQLVITSTVDFAFQSYPLPADKFGSSPEVSDVVIQNQDRIWFSAPGAEAIGSFRPSYWPWSPIAFTPVSDPSGITPQSIIFTQGYPWFTDESGNQIGKFFPQTIALFDFYAVPEPNAGLYDLAAAGNNICFSARDAGQVGRLNTKSRSVLMYDVPNSRPLGVDADGSGHVWIADSDGDEILEWRAPYFYQIFLPLLSRG